jgi:hypothetical protein
MTGPGVFPAGNQLRRGGQVRLLFVTAAGMSSADAADLVRRMADRYRLPTHCAVPIPLRGQVRPLSARPAASPTDLHTRGIRKTRTFTTSAIVDKYAVLPDHPDGGTSI